MNGDILVWNEQLGHAFELSSMGIRVDEDALKRQVEITGDQDRLKLIGTKPCYMANSTNNWWWYWSITYGYVLAT